MKPILALTLVFALAFQHVQSSSSCHMRELELCVATMLLFSQGSGLIPATEEDLQSLCSYVQEAYQCAGNYSSKCMTEQIRELASMFVQGTVESTKEFCTAGSEIQKTWLKHAPCLSENFDKGRKCFNDIALAVDAMASAKPKDRVPLFCCAFSRVRQCLVDETTKNCNKDAAEMIDVLIRSFATELPLIMSKPFDPDSDTCKSILPPVGTKPREGDDQSSVGRLLSAFLGS